MPQTNRDRSWTIAFRQTSVSRLTVISSWRRKRQQFLFKSLAWSSERCFGCENIFTWTTELRILQLHIAAGVGKLIFKKQKMIHTMTVIDYCFRRKNFKQCLESQNQISTEQTNILNQQFGLSPPPTRKWAGRGYVNPDNTLWCCGVGLGKQWEHPKDTCSNEQSVDNTV